MSDEVQRHDLKPSAPAIDEAYWAALLDEGEHAQSAYLDPRLVDEEYADDIQSSFNALAFDHESTHDDWNAIIAATGNDQTVELRVVGYNRGGLLVEWGSLRGFVPASQLIDFPSTGNANARRNALMDRLGQNLSLRVIELSVEKNRLILSERAAQAAPGERDTILHSLEPGDTVSGNITNLCDFGAFVDLGGLEGLIHISELSWGRVAHPSHLLQRDQLVKAYVIDVDQNAGRIALSLKRLCPDPWKTVDQRYTIGEVVEGVVTNVVDFGAFACIEEGLEGLIHVSELAEGHFLHPRNVVTEGQHIQARILTINGDERRLGLSLRLFE